MVRLVAPNNPGRFCDWGQECSPNQRESKPIEMDLDAGEGAERDGRDRRISVPEAIGASCAT